MKHGEIGIEEYAALGHEGQCFVIDHGPVLDLVASGSGGGLRSRRGLRMYDRPKPNRLGLAACSLNLFLCHARPAAGSDTLRAVDLDDVRSFGLQFANFFPDL